MKLPTSVKPKWNYIISIAIKRTIDYLISSILILLTLPLIIAIAVAIKLVSPGSVFFLQKRVGMRRKTIKFIKFRTMYVDAEERLQHYLALNPQRKREWQKYHRLQHDPRLIPYIGEFLRKTNLDELPNLFNVLLGDISLVGPRPLPSYEYTQLDRKFLKLRETVLPGITGLWQIRRGDIKDLIRWDSYYIENWSLITDFQIMLETIKVVLFAKKSRC